MLKSIIEILQNGSVGEQIGLISGLLGIIGAIGWVGKVAVGRLLFPPHPPSPPPQTSDARAIAEMLAREARARGQLEGRQEAAVELAQREAEVGALTRTIDELKAGARANEPGMGEALAALERGETEQAEALFDRIAEAKAAEGAAANKEAARALRNKGNLAFLHDTQKAMATYARAVELDPDDPTGWNQLGQLQARTGALDAAAQSFERVLALGNKLADKSIEAVAIGNLGLIYRRRGELDRAEAMFKRDLELSEQLGSKEGHAATTGNLGLIYMARGKLDRAEEMLRRVLDLAEELGSKEQQAIATANLGSLYEQKGDMARACDYWRKACDLYREIGIAHMVEEVEGWMREAGCGNL